MGVIDKPFVVETDDDMKQLLNSTLQVLDDVIEAPLQEDEEILNDYVNLGN